MVTSADGTVFAPPGPGTWTIDTTHMPRPLALFHREAFPEPFMRGFHSTTSRYGWLFDHLEPGDVHGLTYYRLQFPPPDELPARFEAAERAFATKLWRSDMKEWETAAKPASIRRHLELQAVDPASLGDAELLEHLARCREWLGDMVFQHHRFNGAAIAPVGDFLVQAGGWTGRPAEEHLELLRGFAPASAGASPELEALAAAIRDDDSAQAALSAGDPAGALLEELRSRPGRVGEAARAYLEAHGHRIVDGFDIGNPTALEMPETLVGAIRAAVARGRFGPSEEEIAEVTSRHRDLVPDAHRAAFDDLLAEARGNYGLRDERGIFGEVWASGIVRRVVLEAGRRLAEAGRLDRPEQLCEAGHEEIRALVEGRGGPSAAELEERATRRLRTHSIDAPPFLGDPPQPPPPADGLPPAAAQMARAVDCVLGSLFGESQVPNERTRVFGLAGSPGVYEGTARVVFGPESFGRIQPGDVLVTHSTSEAFNTLLPLLGGIVSDSGGALSHAAIVAREFGIPAVVGTREATKLIPDGARVRVDAGNGVVEILG